MRLLLDTHVVIWAVGTDGLLSHEARGAISDPANTLVVSAASAYEISLKHRLGKLPAAGALVRAWSESLGRLGAEELPITHEHGRAAGVLAWDHCDPFDRLLAGQALTEGLTLVTRDRAFHQGPPDGLSVLW